MLAEASLRSQRKGKRETDDKLKGKRGKDEDRMRRMRRQIERKSEV